MVDDDATRDLIEVACNFWFHGSDQIRSPFPVHIRESLRHNAERSYLEWLEQLGETDQDVSEDEFASFFEYFLFREALLLVGEEDSDLVLTLHHPFMPRVGDLVRDEGRGAGRVVARELEQRDDDKLYMVLSVEGEGSGERWQTAFLIPT